MSFARGCLLFGVAVLIWSGIGPVDRKVWFMETAPAAVGGAWVLLRWRAFPWTPLSVGLMTFFAFILCVGGHWTYSQVPFGFWLREQLGWERNPWDRFGHVFQGVIPAIMARELFLRCTGLRRGKALFWTCVCIALAVSGVYELVEWWTVLIAAPEQGMAFLGVQGDEWDAQQDMAMALCGALGSLLLFSRLHDRQLKKLEAPSAAPR
jgi:putative membrane protein